jgi:hypothetical protein
VMLTVDDCFVIHMLMELQCFLSLFLFMLVVVCIMAVIRILVAWFDPSV